VYAVIRTGGKQYRVKVGDVIDVEKLPADDGADLTFAPLLVVEDDGTVRSLADDLAGASVNATVLDQHRGRKLRIFTYKNKTGQRRTMGHRQSLTRLRVAGIELPGGRKATSAAKARDGDGEASGTQKEAATAAEPKAKPARTRAAKPKPKAEPTAQPRLEADEAPTAEPKAKAKGEVKGAATAEPEVEVEGEAKAEPEARAERKQAARKPRMTPDEPDAADHDSRRRDAKQADTES
jgi:large subunit ribosomal protein L21